MENTTDERGSDNLNNGSTTPIIAFSTPTGIDAHASKGGYTWTKSELRNTLNQSKDGNKEKIHLLRSLLSNPGIGMGRPTTKKRRLQNGRKDHGSGDGPLLPEVIKEYIGIGNILSHTHTATSDTDVDQIIQDLHTDLSKIARSRVKTQKMCGPVDDPIFPTESRGRQILQNKRRATSSLCKEQIDVVLYFVQPSSYVKVAYASQLYDRYIELHNNCHDHDHDHNTHDHNLAMVLLKKLQNLALLDSQLCEVLVLILLEPLRRGIFAPFNENRKRPFWVESILCQSFDPSHFFHHTGKSLDILETAVIDCLRNKNHVKIWDLPTALLVLSSKLYFRIGRTCIELLIEGAITSFEEVPAYMVGRANKNQKHVVVEINKRAFNNTECSDSNSNPMEIFHACTKTLDEMITACSCLHALYSEISTVIRDSSKSKALE
eukprot:CAMPEP_0203670432 /NCGR_PEP_ID=MMETSP0090-20130426/6506_1 /ASSEMBLY_ACC=CAM_ASM_001088 /TAXON_ID=426623 /ORGANISM="Chaetoceros affinis, Strain CCMP159" /LENGTH=433 /DNA_ID=CAMNT_0050535293 /DNA_START=220 /DNA_END=1518 /DNA_ORIENTATION=-